jgi:hypothetical protein
MQTSGTQVFMSYAHADRARVERLVKQFKKRRWSVWWDKDIRIGERWRNAIAEQARAARCMVVVWTTAAVRSREVAAEARLGRERGVLVPVRLERVQPPARFRDLQYADLADWKDRPHAELRRLVKAIGALVRSGLPAPSWPSLRPVRDDSRRGVRQARDLTRRLRAVAVALRKDPAAAARLGRALAEIARTYRAVETAVDDFLAPLRAGKALTANRYRRYARGALVARIEASRGHCTQLTLTYLEPGGLRDAVAGVRGIPLRALDDVFDRLSQADYELFDQMAAVGRGLSDESAKIANLLISGQDAEAKTRLQRAEQLLTPLSREVNAGMAELRRIAAESGLPARAADRM